MVRASIHSLTGLLDDPCHAISYLNFSPIIMFCDIIHFDYLYTKYSICISVFKDYLSKKQLKLDEITNYREGEQNNYSGIRNIYIYRIT